MPTISGDYYFRLPGGQSWWLIVKNLLSKDPIVRFVTDTEFYMNVYFSGIFFRVKVSFNLLKLILIKVLPVLLFSYYYY